MDNWTGLSYTRVKQTAKDKRAFRKLTPNFGSNMVQDNDDYQSFTGSLSLLDNRLLKGSITCISSLNPASSLKLLNVATPPGNCILQMQFSHCQNLENPLSS